MCRRAGDLIKSTRDKFEKRILSGDENAQYISPLFRFATLLFRKPVGVREIRSEIREIAVEGGTKPTINPTSRSYRCFLSTESKMVGVNDIKGQLPTDEDACSMNNYSSNCVCKIDVLITFNFKIQHKLSVG